jgi:hypothetical protein
MLDLSANFTVLSCSNIGDRFIAMSFLSGWRLQQKPDLRAAVLYAGFGPVIVNAAPAGSIQIHATTV